MGRDTRSNGAFSRRGYRSIPTTPLPRWWFTSSPAARPLKPRRRTCGRRSSHPAGEDRRAAGQESAREPRGPGRSERCEGQPACAHRPGPLSQRSHGHPARRAQRRRPASLQSALGSCLDHLDSLLRKRGFLSAHRLHSAQPRHWPANGCARRPGCWRCPTGAWARITGRLWPGFWRRPIDSAREGQQPALTCNSRWTIGSKVMTLSRRRFSLCRAIRAPPPRAASRNLLARNILAGGRPMGYGHVMRMWLTFFLTLLPALGADLHGRPRLRPPPRRSMCCRSARPSCRAGVSGEARGEGSHGKRGRLAGGGHETPRAPGHLPRNHLDPRPVQWDTVTYVNKEAFSAGAFVAVPPSASTWRPRASSAPRPP